MQLLGAGVVLHRLIKTHTRLMPAVLLCKRTHDAPVYEAHWSVFGGGINKGEAPKAAAIREVREELGIVLLGNNLKRLCDVRIQRGAPKITGFRFFTCPLDVDMDRLTLQVNRDEGKVEGEGLAWFTAEEIHHLLIRPIDREAIGLFYRDNGY